MDIRQAAEKALKALEVQWHLTNGNKQIGGAIDALRAALSEDGRLSTHLLEISYEDGVPVSVAIINE